MPSQSSDSISRKEEPDMGSRVDVGIEAVLQQLQNHDALARLVGTSPSFRQAISTLPTIAQSAAAVLITGETGTGKELAARAIHYLSPRAGSPFVPINCGAIPETLIESEMFGHERGAFTDARTARTGLFAQAKGGTLFLDEIDALSSRAQITLLRAIQEKSYRALGSHQESKSDVRVVAATNTALADRVRDGLFRNDLYYRLSIFNISLPALRQRREDIIPLARHFIELHKISPAAPSLSTETVQTLVNYDWPGNIRELENAIIRAVHLCNGAKVEPVDLHLANASEAHEAPAADLAADCHSFKLGKKRIVAAFEKSFVIRALQACKGNVSQAARASGKERRDFGKLLRKYSINPRDFIESKDGATHR